MHVHFPIPGVQYPPEEAVAHAFDSGHAIEQTAGDLIRDRACLYLDKPFIISESGSTTYEQFDSQTERLAAGLLDLGLAPGDRALFQMGTTEATLLALFGCYKAGIVPVCTLPQHREHEIGAMIKLTEARAYFVQEDFSTSFALLPFAEEMARKNGHVKYIITVKETPTSIHRLTAPGNHDTARKRTSLINLGACDVLTFQLSGGSTGTPKIIPRLHGEYIGQSNSLVRRHRISSSDVTLWPLPLIHNAAMVMIVFPTILAGGTLVLRKRFELVDFLRAIERHNVTYAGSIGPIAQSLLDYHDLNKHCLTSMRMFFSLDRAEEIERHLGIPTINVYGITEGLLMSSHPDDSSDMRFDGTGYPTGGGDRVMVLKPNSEIPVDAGCEGELCFTGPHAIRGYYNAPELNSTAFTTNGFFRTGDLVRTAQIDNRVSYRFLGRIKDNISRGGEKFSAEEVEKFIVRHPAITDAKVVAMPDRMLGEKACAFVIVKRGERCPSTQDLSGFLSDCGLTHYKHPERIETIAHFPVTLVGKVDKVALRAEIARRMNGEAQHNLFPLS